MESQVIIANKAAAATAAHQIKLSALGELGENVVYLMGTSFILGSLFTIFILLLLDFMQRDRMSK
jgi:hypothetical protein